MAFEIMVSTYVLTFFEEAEKDTDFLGSWKTSEKSLEHLREESRTSRDHYDYWSLVLLELANVSWRESI